MVAFLCLGVWCVRARALCACCGSDRIVALVAVRRCVMYGIIENDFRETRSSVVIYVVCMCVFCVYMCVCASKAVRGVESTCRHLINRFMLRNTI